MKKASSSSGGLRPRVVMAIPCSITAVEKRAVFTSAERAGAGQVFLIPEWKAGGVGAGLPISEPLASMVCDIGGGTTDVAVFSLADIVASQSIRIAGDEMDDAIVEYLKQHFSLRIGTQTAEQIKIEIGSAAPLDQELTSEVRGCDTIGGGPRQARVPHGGKRGALPRPGTSLPACI